MSEWLDLMLDEIARKQREAREADEELKRREKPTKKKPTKKKPTKKKPTAPASCQSK